MERLRTSTISSSSADVFSLKYGLHELSPRCLVCLDILKNPFRDLICGHVFCHECITIYNKVFRLPLAAEDDEESSIACPSCKSLTKCSWDQNEDAIPYDNVNDANKTNPMDALCCPNCDVCVYNTNLEESEYYCTKCNLNLCEVCKEVHNEQAIFSHHSIVHITNKQSMNIKCEQHSNRIMIYFCESCQLPICCVCLLYKHDSHICVGFSEAMKKRRDVLRGLLNDLYPKLNNIDLKLRKYLHISSQQTNYSSERASGSHSFSNGSHLNELNKKITSGRKISYVEKPGKNDDVNNEVNLFSLYLDNLRKLSQHTQRVIECFQPTKLLSIYQEIVCRLKSVIKDDIFQMNEYFEKLFLQYKDTVSSTWIIPRKKSNASFSISESMISSNNSSLQELNKEEPLRKALLLKPKLLWKVEKLKQESNDMFNPSDACFLNESMIIVTEYDNTNEGNNRINIYDITRTLKRPITIIDKIKPLGVAVTPEGHIAVTDCKSKRVKIFNHHGLLMKEWSKGQFGWPFGIAVNSLGQFIVSDAFNDTVSIHQADGKKIRQFGSTGSHDRNFHNPYHIAVDKENKIFVCDFGNNCIKAFNMDGIFLYKTSSLKPTRTTGFTDYEIIRKTYKLKCPRGITIDHLGNILVSDDYSRICMFDSDLKFIRNILSEDDAVKFPVGINADNNSRLIVTEWNPPSKSCTKVFQLYE